MLGALGGLTVVGMLGSYRLDRRLIPLMWAVATGAMVAYEGGLL